MRHSSSFDVVQKFKSFMTEFVGYRFTSEEQYSQAVHRFIEVHTNVFGVCIIYTISVGLSPNIFAFKSTLAVTATPLGICCRTCLLLSANTHSGGRRATLPGTGPRRRLRGKKPHPLSKVALE